MEHLYTQQQSSLEPIHQDQQIQKFTEQHFTISMIDTACGYSFCHRNEIIVSKTDPFQMSKFSTNQTFFKRNLNNNLNVVRNISPYAKTMEQIKQLYKKHQIDPAYSKLNNLFQEYIKINSFKNLQKSKEDFYKQLKLEQEDLTLLKLIQEEYSDLKTFDKQLQKTGWIQKSRKNGLKISLKRQQSSVGVLAQCTINVPIQVFLTVLTQIDLIKQFTPFIQKSQLVKIPSRNCRIGYSISSFPIISKRQALFDGLGYDRLDHNSSIFLYTRSIHNRPDLQKKYNIQFQQKKNTVMIDYKYLILEYVPIDKQSGHLKFAANTDLKINVPMFLLEMASQGFGYDMLANMMRVSKNFKGSPWQQKMLLNPQFFKFIEERQAQYWQRIQKIKSQKIKKSFKKDSQKKIQN